jgi:uncharacterized protein
MKTADNYYVYCYIDPRNLEEFYYGKGTGNRSKAHLLEQGKSEKAARLREIRAAGVEPIIRVIATDLTEDQAFWTEAALLWKLGKRLTNKIGGRDVAKFRPQNTFHVDLVGFDFSGRIHFFNVGEQWGERSWDDCRVHGFLSAGYGKRYVDAIRQLHKGDVVLAYVSKHGYVGLGRVTCEAVPARDFRVGKKGLHQLKLKAPGVCHDSDDLEKCEYLVVVDWLAAKDRQEAIWKRGLFTARQTRASLAGQPKTLRYVEQEWGIRFESILDQDGQ